MADKVLHANVRVCARRWHGQPSQPKWSLVQTQTGALMGCLTNLACLRYLAAMDKAKNDLGTYLARVRKDLGLSLRTVEAETDVSNAYLSQLETGKIKTPSPTVLHTLALRYEVAYERLMALAGYPVPGNAPDDPNARSLDLAARLGDVSPEEEEALVDFLGLIRKRQRGRS